MVEFYYHEEWRLGHLVVAVVILCHEVLPKLVNVEPGRVQQHPLKLQDQGGVLAVIERERPSKQTSTLCHVKAFCLSPVAGGTLLLLVLLAAPPGL